MNKKMALIVLDGWGHSDVKEGNAMNVAKLPTFENLYKNYPYAYLDASGEAVGLPKGQMGNSEVGHLNIGAGRVVYQPLVLIFNELEDGSLFERENMKRMFEHVQDSNKKLHFIGLLSDGGVHSHMGHLFGLLKHAKEIGLKNVYVHAILDGRDVAPDSGAGYVQQLQDYMHELGVGKIASVSGRYYAMDRDNRWERIQKAYDAIAFGKGPHCDDPVQAVKSSYEQGVTDEFVVPVVIDDQGIMDDGDSVLFYNFRPDRARQMTRVLTEDIFEEFERKPMKLDYYCMTQYDSDFKNVRIIYPNEGVKNTLGEYISDQGLKQFRTAETEKYAHVTFFINGGREEAFDGESRKLVPSPKVATYDLKPEMSAYEVTNVLAEAVKSDEYDLFVCNYANADMVGHTGVFDATVRALEVVDECLGKLIPICQQHGVSVLITADHGNADEMIMPDTKKVSTQHSTNLVPVIVVDDDIKALSDGKLSDVAPTVLEIMGLAKPAEFTGVSLIKEKK